MYTRVNTIFGPKDRVEAGITQIEGPDRAAVEATSGNRGLTTMVNREAAVIIAISYWDEPDRSSEAELTRARQNAVAAAAGDLVAENYVLALDERASIPHRGPRCAWRRYRSRRPRRHRADLPPRRGPAPAAGHHRLPSCPDPGRP